MTNTSLEVIGYVRCDYKEKFGIPRQSGLTDCATAFIEMLPPYNQAEAFRGLDGFSHIWLLWDFSRAHKNGFTATVKPPKLGGNQRMGVFATRSPFRPNNIGLSSVKLLDIIYNEETGCTRACGVRSRYTGWDTGVRHQALSAIHRQPPGGDRGLNGLS